jgi:agmatinase
MKRLSLAPQATFLGAPFLEARAAALRAHGAKAALLGIPYDMGGIFRTGTAAGPRGLREASRQYLGYFFDDDVDLLETYRLVDCGDAPMVPASPAKCRQAAKAAAKEILRAGALGIFIGGDHSLPIPLGEAVAEETSGKVGYIVFDANMDAEDAVDGEVNSNWSGVRRLSELANVSPRNMVLIGIRGSLNTKGQTDYCRKQGIRVIGMPEVIERGIVPVMREALAIAGRGTEALYVSFDTDGIDAAYAPGTSGPEPGGLTSREILTAARMIGRHGVTLFDIVEYCPAYDPSGITGKLCCYIIFNLLGARYVAEREKAGAKPKARPARRGK